MAYASEPMPFDTGSTRLSVIAVASTASIAVPPSRPPLFQPRRAAAIRADDADRALRDRRQRMHQLTAVQAADDVAAAFAQRADAKRRRGRAADEIERTGDAAQLLHSLRRARIDSALRAELGGSTELGIIDVAGDDVLRALLAQDRDADEPQAAAAEHCDLVLRSQLRKLRRRAIRGERRAGERRSEGVVDAARVDEVFRVGHE